MAAAIIFVLAREWRVVAGAIVAGAAQFATAVLYWGPAILGDYVKVLGRLLEVVGDAGVLLCCSGCRETRRVSPTSSISSRQLNKITASYENVPFRHSAVA